MRPACPRVRAHTVTGASAIAVPSGWLSAPVSPSCTPYTTCVVDAVRVSELASGSAAVAGSASGSTRLAAVPVASRQVVTVDRRVKRGMRRTLTAHRAVHPLYRDTSPGTGQRTAAVFFLTAAAFLAGARFLAGSFGGAGSPGGAEKRLRPARISFRNRPVCEPS